jgi:hypothetical protein
MITNDEQMDQAVDQLGRMYCALSSLRRDVLPKSRQWFTLMAEGPMDEIRRLEEQIAEYSGRAAVEINESDVLDRSTEDPAAERFEEHVCELREWSESPRLEPIDGGGEVPGRT